MYTRDAQRHTDTHCTKNLAKAMVAVALTGVVFFFSCFAMAGLATVSIQMPEMEGPVVMSLWTNAGPQ